MDYENRIEEIVKERRERDLDQSIDLGGRSKDKDRGRGMDLSM